MKKYRVSFVYTDDGQLHYPTLYRKRLSKREITERIKWMIINKESEKITHIKVEEVK